MAKFELVRFIDPADDSVTFAQFTDDRTKVAIYNEERYARQNFGDELFFDDVAEVKSQGSDYTAALEAALEGEVVDVLED